MKIDYHQTFIKQYRKLTPSDKAAVDKAIRRFQNNSFDSALRNHPLVGDMVGYRSINARFDLRIIFKEWGGYAHVVFVQVGSHGQLYG